LVLRDREQSPCTRVSTPQTAGNTSNPCFAGRKSFSTKKLHPCSSQPYPDSNSALRTCLLMLLQTCHEFSCNRLMPLLQTLPPSPLEDQSVHCLQGSLPTNPLWFYSHVCAHHKPETWAPSESLHLPCTAVSSGEPHKPLGFAFFPIGTAWLLTACGQAR